jgi:hypothetical protein
VTKVVAWIRRLNDGVQYFAKVDDHESVAGQAYNFESGHDFICDYVYGIVPRFDDWEIEER